MRKCSLAIALLCAPACGGSAPSAPSSSATPDPRVAVGTGITIFLGDTGAPAAGATVVVAGKTYTADASGTVRLAEAALPDALVDIIHPTTFDRQTTLRSAAANRFTLWPRTTAAGIDDGYTATLVYTDASRVDAPVGANPLYRPQASATHAAVLLAPALLADSGAHAAHEDAVERLNAALGGAFRFALAAERPSAGIVVDVRFDAGDPDCSSNFRGYSRLTLRAGEIVGASVVYCDFSATRSSTVTHELGHSFGLRHSREPSEVMYRTFSARRAVDFGPRETQVMALMLQRRGGNRFPDNDRTAAASVGTSVTVTTVCR